MFNIGGGEFLIIFLVALVVLGPAKLPDAARQAGKIIGEFRRVSAGFQREIQTAMNDPVSKVTGEATPRTLKDVTSVAEVPAMDDSATPLDTENPTKKSGSDPFGGATISTFAPASPAEPAPITAGPTAPDIVESAEADVESNDDPPDAPVMYGDR